MKRILVVEDDPRTIQEIQNVFFGQKDYELSVSETGEEGLLKIRVSPPDLVLLDIMLPEIDGFEICRRIKEMPFQRRPKIILLTALTPLLNQMESHWLDQTGAICVMTKPINRSELLNQIEKSLKP